MLASGTGTILAALIAADLPIAVVSTDRACQAEEIARRAGIEAVRVERRDFSAAFDREAYTSELVDELTRHGVDVVAMAGFGTILSPSFVERFEGRVLNTHPSLLPKHKGWHAVAAALSAGDRETGCTVHVVTAAVDEGPILAQAPVAILPGDSEAALHERIKEVERRLYPATVRAFLERAPSPGSVVTHGRSEDARR